MVHDTVLKLPFITLQFIMVALLIVDGMVLNMVSVPCKRGQDEETDDQF